MFDFERFKRRVGSQFQLVLEEMRNKSNNVGKSIRKIVQVGNASAITLPVDFFEKSDLERGDKVEIIFSNNILKIQPLEDEKIEKGIEG